ncbi:hypothetical protein [Snodgrassella alvi]|uniref:hypothetical protein n=1 Tax=Snodgrassella alvi TaxID=1196083 RepID=UPI00346014F7
MYVRDRSHPFFRELAFFHLSDYVILENQLFSTVHAHTVVSSAFCVFGAIQSRTSIFGDSGGNRGRAAFQ